MLTPNGNIVEWFFGDSGFGFDLFVGNKLPVTDGKFYLSDDQAIAAGLVFDQHQ